jgi:predicted dehydrogenase
MKKLRWGILGAAGIARKQLIPALKQSEFCELAAVASRDPAKGSVYARENDIPVAYGSYEELLADPSIDVIYNPLPNHLHVEWTRKAVEAGKSVLCEKPLALKVSDVEELIRLRDHTGLMIGEAYAIFHQPRLHSLKALLDSGEIGRLESAHGIFTLNNRDPKNIRNLYQEGGGALWDIGVYPVTVGRWMFGEEPSSVTCVMELDQQFKVDHHTTGILRFPSGGQMSFTCGMRFPPHSAMTFFTGTHRVEIDQPFMSGPNPQEFIVYDGSQPPRKTPCDFADVNQYQLECDNFYHSLVEGVPYMGSLEQTLASTKVLVALFKAAKSGRFESV